MAQNNFRSSCKQFVTSFSGEGVSDQLYQRAFQLEAVERVISRWSHAVVWAGLGEQVEDSHLLCRHRALLIYSAFPPGNKFNGQTV